MVEIKNKDKTETIKIWKNDANECFVFLPSYAELENTYISLKKSQIYLDDDIITDGQNLKNIELSKTYTISFDCTDDTYPIQFLQSANVASMYVNTQTGKMDKVYGDKNYKENASILLYTSDGDINYYEKRFVDSIKCRGNTTFIADKKPFLLDLSNPNDLLGMGSARKWVLLANAYDPTNLRNKLVLDFAKKTSLKWTPDCEYVDLYLNGEYNGLYLLCEKVEIGENRLDIDPDKAFLFTLAQKTKVYPGDTTFVTKDNRIIKVIHIPEQSHKSLDELNQKINYIESLIVTNDNNKKAELVEYIDIESWVVRYIIDEVFLNIDADTDSSYFYWNGIDKVCAGPVWDYDLSIASDKRYKFNTLLGSYKKWYSELNDNPIFYNMVKDIYKDQFKCELLYMNSTHIGELSQYISKSSFMNNIKWRSKENDFHTLCEELKLFLIRRTEFLEQYWFSGEKYFNIEMVKIPYIVDCSAHYTVKEGDIFVPDNTDLHLYVPEDDIIWIDNDTHEKYNSSIPITKNKLIYAVVSENTTKEKAVILYNAIMRLLYLLSTTIFIFFLLILVMLEIGGKRR